MQSSNYSNSTHFTEICCANCWQSPGMHSPFSTHKCYLFFITTSHFIYFTFFMFLSLVCLPIIMKTLYIFFQVAKKKKSQIHLFHYFMLKVGILNTIMFLCNICHINRWILFDVQFLVNAFIPFELLHELMLQPKKSVSLLVNFMIDQHTVKQNWGLEGKFFKYFFLHIKIKNPCV